MRFAFYFLNRFRSRSEVIRLYDDRQSTRANRVKKKKGVGGRRVLSVIERFLARIIRRVRYGRTLRSVRDRDAHVRSRFINGIAYGSQ